MYDVLVMGRGDPLRDLDGDPDRLLDAQTALLNDVAFQRDPLDQLHDDKVQILLVHHIVYADNIRMREPRSGLGLHLEFTDKIGILAEFVF